MRCRHKSWTEVKRTFNPPRQGDFRAQRATADFALTMMYGLTVVELKCLDCGDTKFVTTPGRS
jgi:hypothetical protein